MAPIAQPAAAPVAAPAAATAAKPTAAQAKAATQFEAVFLGQMMQLMLGSVEPGEFSGGHGEEMFRGVLAEKLGTEIAKRGGVGLAPAVLAQIVKMQEEIAVAAELIDAMISLTSLMEDESARVGRVGNLAELAEIAGAKVKLAGWLEVEVARLRRESPDWMAELDAETHALLAEASRELRDASLVNARVLERQIELSVDMMAAIAGEAQRLTGRRSATLRGFGDVSRSESAAPISINTKL